jgi:hypothetical protein
MTRKSRGRNQRSKRVQRNQNRNTKRLTKRGRRTNVRKNSKRRKNRTSRKHVQINRNRNTKRLTKRGRRTNVRKNSKKLSRKKSNLYPQYGGTILHPIAPYGEVIPGVYKVVKEVSIRHSVPDLYEDDFVDDEDRLVFDKVRIFTSGRKPKEIKDAGKYQVGTLLEITEVIEQSYDRRCLAKHHPSRCRIGIMMKSKTRNSFGERGWVKLVGGQKSKFKTTFPFLEWHGPPGSAGAEEQGAVPVANAVPVVHAVAAAAAPVAMATPVPLAIPGLGVPGLGVPGLDDDTMDQKLNEVEKMYAAWPR